MEDKFEWLPTECAPIKFPMQILKAEFICDDGQVITIPNGRMVYNGWGNIGSTHIVGENNKPVPKQLKITWFSFTEDKFYSGNFSLPKDQMVQYFKTGFISPMSNEKTTYNKILVGLAPEGIVSLWLMGEKITKQICLLKATPVEIEWSIFVADPDYPRAKYIKKKLEQIFSKEDFINLRTNGIPVGLWDNKYMSTYKWEPKFITISQMKSIHISYFNAEREYRDLTDSPKIVKLLNLVPQTIIIKWINTAGINYRAEIFFAETEIFNAFSKIDSLSVNTQIGFQFQINDISPSVKLALDNDKHIIELKECTVKLYSN